MSDDYYVITGERTGHRWLAQLRTGGRTTAVTVRHDWSNDPGFGGISYYPGCGKTFVSRFTWWAMAKAQMFVRRWDRQKHQDRLYEEKVRRIAERKERP